MKEEKCKDDHCKYDGGCKYFSLINKIARKKKFMKKKISILFKRDFQMKIIVSFSTFSNS